MSDPAGRSYRRGDTGPAVAEIRAKLAVLGLLADGAGRRARWTRLGALFDDATDRAVRAFQQQRGITVDGIVGPQTYRALDEARWRLGDRILSYVPARLMAGDDVAALQQRLLDMGFDCGRVDGMFGVETEQALREFQRNVGVVADGTCGPATLKALTQLTRTVVGGRPHAMRESEAINRAGPTLAGKLVIIDPGHGGGTAASSGTGLDEARAGLRPRLADRGPAQRPTGVLGVPDPRAGRRRDADEADRAASPTPPAPTWYLPARRRGTHNAAGGGCRDLLLRQRPDRPPLGGRRALADLVQREVCARTDLVDCRAHAEDLGPAAPHPDAGRAHRARLPHQPRRRGAAGRPRLPRRARRGDRRRRAAALPAARRRTPTTGILRIPELAAGLSRSAHAGAGRLTPAGTPAPGSSSRAAAPAPPRRPRARTARSAGPAAAAGTGGAGARS